MILTDKTKSLILIAIIGIAIYLFTYNSDKNNSKNVVDDDDDDSQNVESMVSNLTGDASIESKSTITSENRDLAAKFKTRDSAKDGSYKYSNYVDGGKKRSELGSEFDKFYNTGVRIDEKSVSNDQQFATYSQSTPGGRIRDINKHDVGKLLPDDNLKNKEWADDPYESTKIKNTHLINMYKPIGLNTIQSTLKNPSHDIRGTPPNPKYKVSPWMWSSIEPDTNLRDQSLCY